MKNIHQIAAQTFELHNSTFEKNPPLPPTSLTLCWTETLLMSQMCFCHVLDSHTNLHFLQILGKN